MDCSHIQFCADTSGIDLNQLVDLFDVSAFWALGRRPADLQVAIANSCPVITVWDGFASGDTHPCHARERHDRVGAPGRDRLIGFARATSDGVYRATIWDVVMHPEYQGAGLGRLLVETVLSHPKMSRVERVYLMTTHQQQFYERIGFQRNSTTTMILYNQAIEIPKTPATTAVSQ
ncbi:MAG: GNAT family N-acetyltransferase [Hormoscilla sp. GUM202]|nr:GNAT family N-acetyltransferase [Hormoscilla sp. GM7CHS1pb]MBO1347894.1 GNAT family N-acetyltransferase [Hormoscilla sp. GUM202]